MKTDDVPGRLGVLARRWACIAVLVGACSDGTVTRVFVTSGFTDEVLELDAASGRIVERISLDRRREESDEPHGVAIAPDGRHWYATLAHGEPTLWKYELSENRLVGRLSLNLPGAARIGITPDSRRAFVPDYFRTDQGRTSHVAVVDLATLDLVAQLPLCPAPHHAAVDRAGTQVAVACSLSDEVVIIDAHSLHERGRFYVGEGPGAPGHPRFKPLNLAWGGEGLLWVTLHVANHVAAFDSAGGRHATIAVGEAPGQLALTPDGTTLVVANRGSQTVSILDVAERRERLRVTLPIAHPHGVAISPVGHRAFITMEGSTTTPGGVVALDWKTGRIEWQAEAGAYTLGIAAGLGRGLRRG